MARSEWKPTKGKCAMCKQRGPIFWHHCVTRQHVDKAGGDPWDFRNAMPVGQYCACHDGHHHPGVKNTRFPRAIIPADALAFAVDLLGADRAQLYWKRYYAA